MSKNMVMFFQYGFFGFYTNYLPTWSQGVLGNSATTAGLVLIPSSIALIFSGNYQPLIMSKLSEKQTITLGLILMVIGGATLIIAPQHMSLIVILVVALLLGVGTALVNNTIQVALQEAVATEEVGAATALNSLLRTLGTTMLLSVFALSMNRVLANGVDKAKGAISTLQMNAITDAQAAKHLPVGVVEVGRSILHNGLTMIAIFAVVAVSISIIFNQQDSWKTSH
jgi:fucose permease